MEVAEGWVLEEFVDGFGKIPDSHSGFSVETMNQDLRLGVNLTLLMDQHCVALTLWLHGLLEGIL